MTELKTKLEKPVDIRKISDIHSKSAKKRNDVFFKTSKPEKKLLLNKPKSDLNLEKSAKYDIMRSNIIPSIKFLSKQLSALPKLNVKSTVNLPIELLDIDDVDTKERVDKPLKNIKHIFSNIFQIKKNKISSKLSQRSSVISTEKSKEKLEFGTKVNKTERRIRHRSTRPRARNGVLSMPPAILWNMETTTNTINMLRKKKEKLIEKGDEEMHIDYTEISNIQAKTLNINEVNYDSTVEQWTTSNLRHHTGELKNSHKPLSENGSKQDSLYLNCVAKEKENSNENDTPSAHNSSKELDSGNLRKYSMESKVFKKYKMEKDKYNLISDSGPEILRSATLEKLPVEIRKKLKKSIGHLNANNIEGIRGRMNLNSAIVSAENRISINKLDLDKSEELQSYAKTLSDGNYIGTI